MYICTLRGSTRLTRFSAEINIPYGQSYKISILNALCSQDAFAWPQMKLFNLIKMHLSKFAKKNLMIVLMTHEFCFSTFSNWRGFYWECSWLVQGKPHLVCLPLLTFQNNCQTIALSWQIFTMLLTKEILHFISFSRKNDKLPLNNYYSRARTPKNNGLWKTRKRFMTGKAS